jgi:hypothetical protein
MSLALETLPPHDSALRATIGDATSVFLTRDNTKLLEVVRVLRGARGLKELKVLSAALLREGEKDAVYGSGEVSYQFLNPGQPKHSLWDLERMRPAAAASLERISFTGTVQPGCFRQMEWLAGMLQGALNLKVLKLHVFEYDSERVITDLRAMPDLQPVALPSMIDIAPPGSRTTLTQRRDDEEGRLIGQMMVASILQRHSQQLRIEDRQQHVLERMMEELLTASLPPLENEGESALVAQFKSDALSTGTLSSRRPVLKCMTYEQYDDVLQPLYATQLPFGLEHLTMRAILRGSKVQAQFLFLPCLQTLDLDHCEMDDAAFAILGPVIGRRMPALRKLSLRQNRLLDADLGVVLGPLLEEIDLAQNPISSRAASHLFRSMEDNATLHRVDLAHTNIDRTVSFHGLHRWSASPAQLRIPYCLSDDELVRASRFMHLNVELELVGPMSQELVWCGNDVMMQ